MASITVSYEGKKKSLKISPSSVLQLLLKEICEEFEVDVASCDLKYRNSIIDKSLPFRLLNLPNNAALELLVTTNALGAKNQKTISANDPSKLMCRLAVSMESNPPVTLTLSSSTTLMEVVGRYMTTINRSLDTIPVNQLEVNILGIGYNFDRLNILTLYDLGLAK